MSESSHSTAARRSRRSLLVPAAMLATLPLVSVQGPGHMTAMDGVNILFMAVYWGRLLVHRDSLAFPLALPFWLIVIGSCGGLFCAPDLMRALIAMGQDLYLYLWFITVAHFLVRQCRAEDVAKVWVGIACMVALSTVADKYTGCFGGALGGGFGGKRAVGTFENPNMFGDYLVTSFFLAWAVAGSGRRLYYVAMATLLAGVHATASNGALVSILAGCLGVAAAQPTRRILPYLGTALAAGALVLGLGVVFREQIAEGVLDIASQGRGEIGGHAMKGADERLPLWMDAIESIQQWPMGGGPANFNRAGGLYSGDYHGAHNDYLGMLTERGPIGLVGWIALLAALPAMILRLRRAALAGLSSPLGIAPLFGLVAAITAHSIVIELFHFRHFWLLIAVIWAAATQVAVGGAPVCEVEPALQEAA